MFLFCAQILEPAAFAAPQLPLWQPDDVEDPADAAPFEELHIAQAATSPADEAPTCGITPDEAPLFTWTTASPGTVDLGPVTDEGLEYWLVVTGRIGQDAVEHWTQGPLGTEEDSRATVSPPSALVDAALAQARSGTISARVVMQTTEGEELGRWPLPRLVWTVDSRGVEAFDLFADHSWPAVDEVTDLELVSADL